MTKREVTFAALWVANLILGSIVYGPRFGLGLVNVTTFVAVPVFLFTDWGKR